MMSPLKKATYAMVGALFILAAPLLQRFDGGGPDLMLLIVLGLGLLVASADLPLGKVRDVLWP